MHHFPVSVTLEAVEGEVYYFSYSRCVQNPYKLDAVIFVILVMTMMLLFKENRKELLYPCRTSKITYGKLIEMRAEINTTEKEIESIATVLSLNLTNPNEKLIMKHKNLTSHKKKLEEKWIFHKAEFYECYKNNILEAFYRTRGYYITAYYALISVIFMAIFTLMQIAKMRDLPEEEFKLIKEYYTPTQILWLLHLFVCPFLVWILFHSNDISDRFKREFPIYPHNEQMVDVD